ncbi:hypothetical protein EV715DRAFT_209771 [Schizophyllum commune]
MTRRWKKSKSARYAATALRVPPSYRDMLSNELWHLIFSECTPRTLLAARDTCRLFREIIDRNDGELLARAPLLLSPPPPNPRELMRYTKTAAQYHALRTTFAIKDVHKPGTYGSATYTKLLFQPGPCYVCHLMTNGPPLRILGKVYTCSVRPDLLLLRRLFKGVVHVLAHHKSLPAYAMTFDRHIVPWLPTISLGKQQQTRPVLKRDLADARKEYREKIQILVLSPQEHKRRMHALFSVRTTFSYLTCWELILCTEVPRPLRRDEGLDRSTCTFLPR